MAPLPPATAARVAHHRDLVLAEAELAESFRRFVVLAYDDHDEELARVLELGAAWLPSISLLTIAALAGMSTEPLIPTRGSSALGPMMNYHLLGLLRTVDRRRPVFDVVDVDVLFVLASRCDPFDEVAIESATLAAERLDPSVLDQLAPTFAAALEQMNDHTTGSVGRPLRPRLRALAAHGRTPGGELDLSAIVLGDGWSHVARRAVEELDADPAVVADVLAHLAAATNGTAPTKRWRTAWTDLDTASADARRIARALVQALLAAVPTETRNGWGGIRALTLTQANVDLVRGAVWAVALCADDATPALLAAAATVGHRANAESGFELSEKVANACVTMLGQLGTPEAINQLVELRRTLKHQGVRTQIVKALEANASGKATRTSRLTEGAVPAFELDADGRGSVAVGPAVARIVTSATRKPTIEWFPGTGMDADLDALSPKARVPAAVAKAHPDEVTALKTTVAEIAKVQAAERRRLEAIIDEDDPWPFATWVHHYWRHPLTGHLVRTLLWRVSDPTPSGGNDPFVGIATDEPTRFVDAGGIEHRVDASATTIQPWHPVRSTPAEVRALRRLLEERGIRQPIKQAYREVYLLTPAEQETGTYSNRFAAHVLRYPQLYALLQERGWATTYLTGWGQGREGCARRVFADEGVTAQFFHDPIDTGHVDERGRSLGIELCATDQVRFIRTGDRTGTPLALSDIVPVVFSEAMRDVDLFVAVCSIGNDPNWLDRGEDRHVDYWKQYAFGELSSSAEVRRDALAVILPKLKIADRCELDERNLVVHGGLGTYRIHLGSGNVMMDSSRYLCIVAGRGGAKTSKVFLPFEDDHLLTVILSKAFLLADDTKITDRTILVQMGIVE